MQTTNIYRIFPEDRLIIETYAGPLGMQDILEMKERLRADPEYNAAYNLIEDIRKSRLSGLMKQIPHLVEWLATQQTVTRQSAILTSEPEQVAVAEHFRYSAGKIPMNVRIFSTMEAALFWLKVKNPSLAGFQ